MIGYEWTNLVMEGTIGATALVGQLFESSNDTLVLSWTNSEKYLAFNTFHIERELQNNQYLTVRHGRLWYG